MFGHTVIIEFSYALFVQFSSHHLQPLREYAHPRPDAFIADKPVTFVVQEKKMCAVNIDEFRGKFRSVSIWRIRRFYRDRRTFGYTHHIYFNTHTWSRTVFRNDLVMFCIGMSDYYYITLPPIYASSEDRRKFGRPLSVIFYT